MGYNKDLLFLIISSREEIDTINNYSSNESYNDESKYQIKGI